MAIQSDQPVSLSEAQEDERSHEVTALVAALSKDAQAGTGAAGKLIALIYDDLRKMARQNLSGRRRGETLNTTVLVHESYLRLVRPSSRSVVDRKHFLNLAALAMRQVICDHARRRLREIARFDRSVSSEDALNRLDAEVAQASQLLALEEALNDLARIEPRQARIVECRYFSGLSDAETAEVLDISERTVYREWARARRWLEAQLASK